MCKPQATLVVRTPILEPATEEQLQPLNMVMVHQGAGWPHGYGGDRIDSSSPNSSRGNAFAPGARFTKSKEPSPAAVALNNQLQVQLALKRARQAAAVHNIMMPTVPESFALIPHSSSSSSYPAPSYANQCVLGASLTSQVTFAPQQPQYSTASHAALAQELQEALLLQQQQAEVDAAINNMLTLRQQLAAISNAAAFPAATPVSLATAALGMTPQLDCVPIASVNPAAATATAAAVAVPAAAAAQVQLAQLQAQQQQLLSVEQQLQLQLQAEMARLMTMA